MRLFHKEETIAVFTAVAMSLVNSNPNAITVRDFGGGKYEVTFPARSIKGAVASYDVNIPLCKVSSGQTGIPFFHRFRLADGSGNRNGCSNKLKHIFDTNVFVATRAIFNCRNYDR